MYSARDDSTWLFFPLTGAMTSNRFSNVPTGAKTFVRFGVRVQNSSGTGVAMGLASLRVETRSA